MPDRTDCNIHRSGKSHTHDDDGILRRKRSKCYEWLCCFRRGVAGGGYVRLPAAPQPLRADDAARAQHACRDAARLDHAASRCVRRLPGQHRLDTAVRGRLRAHIQGEEA
ncbi:hypothetical protein PR048_014771, partial [Dryococelus australis]